MPWFDDLWDFSDPGASENRFRSAIVSEPDQMRVAVLKTQLARALGLQKRFDDARVVLDEIEASQPGEPVNCWVAIERGRIERSSGDRSKALPLFERAVELAEHANEPGIVVDALHMLAISVSGVASVDWNLKAIDYTKDSCHPDTKRWLASLYNNLGWSYMDLGKPDQALTAFEAQLAEPRVTQDPERLRVARWCLGRCYRDLGRLDEAKAVMLDLLAAKDEGAYVREELAYLSEETSQSHDAAVHAEKALEQGREGGLEDTFSHSRLERLQRLANRE